MDIHDFLAKEGCAGVPVFADYEDALVGVSTDHRAVYDYGKMIEILKRNDHMTDVHAEEWLIRNTIPSLEHMGEDAPIIMHSAAPFDGIRFSRTWQMPNSKTFQIKPIREIIEKYIHGLSIDPFANSSRLATVTNDLDEQYDTDHHMDALDFLTMFEAESVDTVLYDPPYSPRQVAECYKALGKTVNMSTTQASYWSKQKAQIGRIVKPGGICITCGWNSGGIGQKYGFEIVEILLVAHGGWHNDTIVTVERKRTDGRLMRNGR